MEPGVGGRGGTGDPRSLGRAGAAPFLATQRLWDAPTPDGKAVTAKLKEEKLSPVAPGDNNSKRCHALCCARCLSYRGKTQGR